MYEMHGCVRVRSLLALLSAVFMMTGKPDRADPAARCHRLDAILPFIVSWAVSMLLKDVQIKTTSFLALP